MVKSAISLHSLSPCVRYARTHETFGLSRIYINPEYVFTYILEGGGFFVLEGRKYSVKRGDLILMPPYMLHVLNPHRGAIIAQYIIHFDLFFQRKRMRTVILERNMTFDKFKKLDNPETLLASIPHVLSPAETEQRRVETLFLKLKEEIDGKQYGFELIAKSIMLEILCIYLRNASANVSVASAPTKGWRNLEKAVRYIHQNYCQSSSLEQVSRVAGLSKNYFCRLFKKYTNNSIHHYINTIRIREAKTLINQADMNFSQIADKVGFSSIYLFSRVFKKIEGVSPSEYSRKKSIK